jgi:hypothetical protein
MEITHEPLHLLTVTYHGHTSFIWIIILSDEALKHGDDAKCWGYVGTNTEPLCLEFRNFVQCHVFVNYLTCR